MKIFLSLLFMIIAGCYGFPKHFIFNPNADFVPCSNADSLQTLWPDFNNNRIFHQCITIGIWGTHNCPANLRFSFWYQVCVWEWQWQAPPAPDVITPFPTTQWPRQTTPGGTTVDQEVTIDDSTTSSNGEDSTIPEITLPVNPDLTPPTPETTTELTPPTPDPTQPGDTPVPDDPILTPPAVETTTIDPTITPPLATTNDPNFDRDAPVMTPAKV